MISFKDFSTAEEVDITEVNQNITGGAPLNKLPPQILVMRRMSIRQFPNGQNVALYYVDKINKYVTVPYMDIQLHAESVVDVLGKIEEDTTIEFSDGTKRDITTKEAKTLVSLYRKVDENNKIQIKEMLSESNASFEKLLGFAKKV